MKFYTFHHKKIPNDIVLKYPENSKHNTLVYIPWDDKYLNLIPDEYKKFFLISLPQLNVRTTDVHTACSLAFLDRIIELQSQPVNRRAVALSLILHDIGWSELSDQEIIDSLSDYQGLKLSKTSLGPKEKHVQEGVKIAEQILVDFVFDPPLTDEEKSEIIETVKLHDEPKKCSLNGQLVADLDRLWSFTHENFWQDTIRKNVIPEKYLENLYQDYKTYFTTQAGRTIAEELLKKRKEEIREYEKIDI